MRNLPHSGLLKKLRPCFFVYLTLVIVATGCSNDEKENECVLYAEMTPGEFRERIQKAPIAYLPLGTLEWHGEHLPLGSDGLQSSEFFIQLARKAGGIVLPMLFLGPDTMQVVNGKELYGTDFVLSKPGNPYFFPKQQLAGSAYRVSDSAFKVIVESTLEQLQRAGFKIVVAHGHGPSTLFIIRHCNELEKKYGMLIYNCWSWNVRGKYLKEYDDKEQEGLGIMVDHAAMNETSLMMYFRPDLVQIENLPSDTSIWPIGIAGKDPRIYASAAFGEKAVNLHIERFVVELKNALKSMP